MIKYGSELYFYHFAPPPTDGSAISASRRPAAPFTDAQPWQCSVYYYWWLFLQESEDYLMTCKNKGAGPCAEVYRDFGDIRRSDFSHWWSEIGRELFCEQRTSSVLIDSDFVNDELRQTRGIADGVGIVFDTNADQEKVLAEMENVIKSHYRARQDTLGRSDKVSTALYPVFTKPVLRSLHNHHEALRLRREQPDLPYHEIAKLSGVHSTPDDGSANWKSVAGNIGWRAVRQAETMAKYAAQGLFPVMTPEHEEEVSTFMDRSKGASALRREEFEHWKKGSSLRTSNYF